MARSYANGSTVALWHRVEVRQVAVVDGAAEGDLHGHDQKPSDSTNIAVADVFDTRSTPLSPGGLRVTATALDALIEKCGRVDLLKLDF